MNTNILPCITDEHDISSDKRSCIYISRLCLELSRRNLIFCILATFALLISIIELEIIFSEIYFFSKYNYHSRIFLNLHNFQRESMIKKLFGCRVNKMQQRYIKVGWNSMVYLMYTHLKSTCIVANLINMMTPRNINYEYYIYIRLYRLMR